MVSPSEPALPPELNALLNIMKKLERILGWSLGTVVAVMGGYGGRPNGKRSTGVHDPLFVKATALSDGKDTVVLLGADMLQTLALRS
jgi:hypothetical protein